MLSELKLLEGTGNQVHHGIFLLPCICFGYFVICVRYRFKAGSSLYYVIILTNIGSKLFAKSIQKHSKRWAEVNQLSILQQQEYLKSKPIIKTFL